MIRSRRPVLAFLLAAVAGLAACGPPPAAPPPAGIELPPPDIAAPAAQGPVVRVLVLETGGRVIIEAGPVTVREAREGGILEKILETSDKGEFAFSRSGGAIRLVFDGRARAEAPLFMITPSGAGRIELDGNPYRGSLLVRSAGSSGLLAINVIEIDDYLKGVLPAEIGYLKAPQYEAYRVQAIASRSYALSKLEEKRGEPYDLRATVMDQVYKGVAGENAEASRAVDETRGLVGLWNGKPITAYYSSCCGGHTADIRTGWPWKAEYPYLYGVRDSGNRAGGKSFCAGSGHFRWEAAWSGGELEKILKKTLRAELGSRVASFSRLIDISVTGVSRSGRVKGIEIVTNNGTYTVEGDRVRWVLRPRTADGPILRSTLFKMDVDRGGGRVRRVSLIGGGNGHGTGMCQSGAIRMAEMGYTAREILLHYYPGITIEAVYR